MQAPFPQGTFPASLRAPPCAVSRPRLFGAPGAMGCRGTGGSSGSPRISAVRRLALSDSFDPGPARRPGASRSPHQHSRDAGPPQAPAADETSCVVGAFSHAGGSVFVRPHGGDQPHPWTRAGLNTVYIRLDNDASTRANPPSPPFGKGGLGGFVCQRGARPACATRSAAGRGDFARLAA